MLCLGIESTAHTFSCAVVNEHGILSDVRSIYRPPEGKGIHPREAAEHHAHNCKDTLVKALREANLTMKDIDIIAYSKGPGLGPCLRVGAVLARSLASYYDKPLVPVNHAIGHLELGMMLTNANNPLVLLISGGHSMILALNNNKWRVFGETLDITIGQLLDQFGREAGFASPCGFIIEELAARSTNYLRLPYTVKGNDVSYSGLLTAAKRLLKEYKLEDICYSLQETAFAMLAEVTERALAFSEKKELLVVGGVAANKRLARMLSQVCNMHNANLFTVPIRFAGDCGAQIAWTGLLEYYSGISIKPEEAIINQSWRLDTVDIIWNKRILHR
jgi:N6-L-threonylcarbamoyladenine synthase